MFLSRLNTVRWKYNLNLEKQKKCLESLYHGKEGCLKAASINEGLCSISMLLNVKVFSFSLKQLEWHQQFVHSYIQHIDSNGLFCPCKS